MVTLMVAISVFASAAADAQQANLPLSGFESVSDTTRMAAFYRILHRRPGVSFNSRENTLLLLRDYPAQRQRISTALIALLGRENIHARQRSDRYFTAYYSDLITSVATLHDIRAINELLGAINIAGSSARTGVAALGNAAVPRTIAALESTRRDTRNTAIHVLGLLASPNAAPILSLGSTARVRAALLRSLRDPQSINRAAAIESLRAFADSEVVSAIARLASMDAEPSVRRRAAEFGRPLR
jgi:hypothetical protein